MALWWLRGIFTSFAKFLTIFEIRSRWMILTSFSKHISNLTAKENLKYSFDRFCQNQKPNRTPSQIHCCSCHLMSTEVLAVVAQVSSNYFRGRNPNQKILTKAATKKSGILSQKKYKKRNKKTKSHNSVASGVEAWLLNIAWSPPVQVMSPYKC